MGRKGEKIAKGKKCWSVSETFFLLIKPLREIFFFNHLTGREKLRKTLNGVEVKRKLHLGCKCFIAWCACFLQKGGFAWHSFVQMKVYREQESGYTYCTIAFSTLKGSSILAKMNRMVKIVLAFNIGRNFLFVQISQKIILPNFFIILKKEKTVFCPLLLYIYFIWYRYI